MVRSLDAMLGQVGPDFWDAAGVAAALPVDDGEEPRTARDVERMVAERRLLALTTFDGRTVFPTWQVVDGQVLPDLAEVLSAFDGQPAWSVAVWLTTEHDELGGRTPAAALGPGAGAEDVVALAARTAAAWS